MLSVTLPTYNEAKNLPELLKGLSAVLSKEEYEVIVVDDDSPDNTWQVAEDLKKHYPMLKVIRRIGRRGLSSAVVEGFNAAKGDVLLVMDSDLQHDPAIVGKLYDAVQGGADIAVASRYIEGGSVGEWVTGRRLLSRFATFLARTLPPVRTSDPMSGFFALTKSSYESVRMQLHPTGFKILFEVLAHMHPSSTVAEVPLKFQMRKHGESKLSLSVEAAFLWQLLGVFLYRFSALLFWVAALVIAIVLMLHVWNLLPMYIDASVRNDVREHIETVTRERGWLLSDIRIRSVTKESFTFIHQQHHRGPDETACYEWLWGSSGPIPCAD